MGTIRSDDNNNRPALLCTHKLYIYAKRVNLTDIVFRLYSETLQHTCTIGDKENNHVNSKSRKIHFWKQTGNAQLMLVYNCSDVIAPTLIENKTKYVFFCKKKNEYALCILKQKMCLLYQICWLASNFQCSSSSNICINLYTFDCWLSVFSLTMKIMNLYIAQLKYWCNFAFVISLLFAVSFVIRFKSILGSILNFVCDWN